MKSVGAQIKATRLADRTVKSDLAIWPLTYKDAADDLLSLYAKTSDLLRLSPTKGDSAILHFEGI